MTEAWAGRKYQWSTTETVVLVESEPFKASDGLTYVACCRPGGHPSLTLASSLEDESHYKRIREPKHAVGDKVSDGYETFTIDAVSRSADKDGDFGYIGRDPHGNFDLIFGDNFEKVSE
ncbi:hypothetical protein E6W39_19055 [Kitasatospora acidiphila]|uniref:Uncharacterized protein n=1 Tax=Kitasatospora acidiphila TaxID=2567942 RepID=A0A540W4J0_9ACTN|nr:hypothetical protein [Kitasatospora acidiphila]TQF03951.1 hypothetical protein E6W39_19055 [Kitasatospora acidiphila]